MKKTIRLTMDQLSALPDGPIRHTLTAEQAAKVAEIHRLIHDVGGYDAAGWVDLFCRQSDPDAEIDATLAIARLHDQFVKSEGLTDPTELTMRKEVYNILCAASLTDRGQMRAEGSKLLTGAQFRKLIGLAFPGGRKLAPFYRPITLTPRRRQATFCPCPGAEETPISAAGAVVLEGVSSQVVDQKCSTADGLAIAYALATESLFKSCKGLGGFDSNAMQVGYLEHDRLMEEYGPAVVSAIVITYLQHAAVAGFEATCGMGTDELEMFKDRLREANRRKRDSTPTGAPDEETIERYDHEEPIVAARWPDGTLHLLSGHYKHHQAMVAGEAGMAICVVRVSNEEDERELRKAIARGEFRGN